MISQGIHQAISDVALFTPQINNMLTTCKTMCGWMHVCQHLCPVFITCQTPDLWQTPLPKLSSFSTYLAISLATMICFLPSSCSPTLSLCHHSLCPLNSISMHISQLIIQLSSHFHMGYECIPVFTFPFFFFFFFFCLLPLTKCLKSHIKIFLKYLFPLTFQWKTVQNKLYKQH